MAVCRPCRHKNHDSCKQSTYRKAGCTCKRCAPDRAAEARLRRLNPQRKPARTVEVVA